MRDQYAGDVSDVLKFALLRALVGADRTLGIAWYYASGDDGRADGRHIEWREESAWRSLDPELYDSLSRLSERSIAALERLTIWPKACRFHSESMPALRQRRAWAARQRAVLDEADVVFLDPDNGLGNETEKHATFEEVKLLQRPRRAIVFITFPGRTKPHHLLVESLHKRLQFEVGAKRAITLRTNISVPRAERTNSYVQRQRWFTVIDPDQALIDRLQSFARSLRCVPRTRVYVDSWPYATADQRSRKRLI